MICITKSLALSILSAGLGFSAFGANLDPIKEAASDFRGQVMIQIKGEVVYEQSFGDLSSDSDDLIDDQTLFYIGSIAKTFTSTIVLQLVEEGKLSLDDPISKYLDDVPADNEQNCQTQSHLGDPTPIAHCVHSRLALLARCGLNFYGRSN